MKAKHNDPRGNDGKPGKPEGSPAKETFAQREKPPGAAGLANEARPGLGTRAEEAAKRNDPGAEREMIDKPLVKVSGEPKAKRYGGYEEPLPEPREQAPNSLAHEEERSTGASGQSGNG